MRDVSVVRRLRLGPAVFRTLSSGGCYIIPRGGRGLFQDAGRGHDFQDGFSEAEAADLTERCELISERLMSLEDELHTAMLNQDQALTQSLEKEVQDVKATLQRMLAQLKEDEGEEEEEEEEEDKEGHEEEELHDDDLMQNGTEEEEEDQYFSDSWDI